MVPHYGFGDPDPAFASNLNLPSGFEALSANLGQVYKTFRSKQEHNDPDGVREIVSTYLTNVNKQLSTHREEQIRNGFLSPDAEAVELRLAPAEDREKLRLWIDGLSQTNEGDETCDRSKYGKADGDDGSTGGTCPEAEARYERIERKLARMRRNVQVGMEGREWP